MSVVHYHQVPGHGYGAVLSTPQCAVETNDCDEKD